MQQNPVLPLEIFSSSSLINDNSNNVVQVSIAKVWLECNLMMEAGSFISLVIGLLSIEKEVPGSWVLLVLILKVFELLGINSFPTRLVKSKHRCYMPCFSHGEF